MELRVASVQSVCITCKLQPTSRVSGSFQRNRACYVLRSLRPTLRLLITVVVTRWKHFYPCRCTTYVPPRGCMTDFPVRSPLCNHLAELRAKLDLSVLRKREGIFTMCPRVLHATSNATDQWFRYLEEWWLHKIKGPRVHTTFSGIGKNILSVDLEDGNRLKLSG